MKTKENLELTKELLELFESSNVNHMEYITEDFSLKLGKNDVEQVVVAPKQVVVPNATSVVEEQVNNVSVNYNEVIKSPIVGTFYASPAPDKPAYVSVGDKVKKGQVVCIVEAMKVMNEITSPFDGEIVEILVNDADGVEFDQVLFHVK